MRAILPSMRDWWERNRPQPKPKPKPKPVPRPQRIYSEINPMERRAIDALAGCRLGMLGPRKYIATLRRATQISDGGRNLLWRWVWRYRRQIADQELVAKARKEEVRA